MDKINAITLCHIGTEFVVIAGVSFWLNRRITSLEEKIDIQNDTISKYEEMINQQGQMLMKHEQIIRQMVGAHPLPSRPSEPGGHKPSPQQPQNQQPRQSQNRQPQTPVNTASQGVTPQSQVEESDISDSELDKLIGYDELSILQGLKNPRKNIAEDPIELICEGDDCDLKSREEQIRIKKRRRKGKKVTIRT
uniref:Uncharacterized protein n=1 Tax=Marseillevirus LCMAC101 TaxID=2506602 RepID=A0A481YRC5_9VIRU|nr:MAG: uncharacterized protein LCMAC101_01070 [Marseillevirus LCMAC101]